MENKTNNFYEEIAKKNGGIEATKIKSVFVWYDLLSFVLSFQLIFILAYSFEIDFAVTMLSAIFIIITDTIIKVALEKDGKNYEKLKSQMALVKLWTIPLIFIAFATLLALLCVTFGLV